MTTVRPIARRRLPAITSRDHRPPAMPGRGCISGGRRPVTSGALECFPDSPDVGPRADVELDVGPCAHIELEVLAAYGERQDPADEQAARLDRVDIAERNGGEQPYHGIGVPAVPPTEFERQHPSLGARQCHPVLD